MTNLDNVLFDLLVHHNCVVIPEFGGFISKRISSRIDYQKGIVYPPSKHLLFNRFLNVDDGLLIASFAQASQEDYDSVKKKLTDFVTELDQRLSNGEEVSFKYIGRLKRTESGHFSFKQDHSFNLLADAYGLKDLDFIPVDDVKVEETKKEQIVEVQPDIATKIKPPKKNRKRILLKYAAAACILPIAFYSFWIPFKSDFFTSGLISLDDFNPFYKKEIGLYEPLPSKAIINPIKKEPVAPEKSNVFVVESTEKDSDIEVHVQDKRIDVKIENQPESSFNLHYIVGSFSVKGFADDFVLKLQEDGFSPFVLTFGNLYRISVGQVENQDELYRLISLANTKGYAGWTLNNN